MKAAKINEKTSATARLSLSAFPSFMPRFLRIGRRRRSTKFTIGFSKNAITMPETSGERILPIAPSSEKKPGRFVKITTSRMLIKMTIRAVRPHLKYRRSCSSRMRLPPQALCSKSTIFEKIRQEAKEYLHNLFAFATLSCSRSSAISASYPGSSFGVSRIIGRPRNAGCSMMR